MGYLVYGIILFFAVSLLSNFASAYSKWMGWDVRLKVQYNLLNETAGLWNILPADSQRDKEFSSTYPIDILSKLVFNTY